LKESEEVSESVTKQNSDADKLVKELQKRRQKLGDADIMENFKNRVDGMNDIDQRLKEVEKDA